MSDRQKLSEGCRIRVCDESGQFTQTELFDGLARAAMHGEDPLPWAAPSSVKVTTNKTLGNLLGLFPHPVRPNGPTVAIIALDNRQGLIAMEASSIRPMTWVGQEIRIVPMRAEVMLQWRKGAEEAFKGLKGYVNALDTEGELATIVEVRRNRAFPGQYVMLAKLDEDAPALFHFNVWDVDGETGELHDRSEEYAEGPMNLFTLLHGFEAQPRRPGEVVGPRRREANARLAAVPPRMIEASAASDSPFAPRAKQQPPPSQETETSDVDGHAQKQPDSSTTAGQRPWVARGFCAEEFNNRVAADPGYIDELLAHPPAPPDSDIWQSRIIRPSNWVWLV